MEGTPRARVYTNTKEQYFYKFMKGTPMARVCHDIKKIEKRSKEERWSTYLEYACQLYRSAASPRT